MEWYWVFYNQQTTNYIVLKDSQVTSEVRWNLLTDGFEVLTDCATSYKTANSIAKDDGLSALKYEVRPISLKEANNFVSRVHRHHKATQGHKFSIALFAKDTLIGVVIAGRPVARHKDDGLTLEITRCCVLEQYKNGASKLISAVCQSAQGMGYKRVITYTLSSESGKSMKASNFRCVGTSPGGSWNSNKRKRLDKHPLEPKYIWLKEVG